MRRIDVRVMKLILLKGCFGLAGLFATCYLYFLSSTFYELYGPSGRFCGTAQFLALEGAAFVFAPTALITAVGLWIVRTIDLPLGAVCPLVSKASRAVLLLCAFVNLVVFLPVL
jgi:hypothetical protein